MNDMRVVSMSPIIDDTSSCSLSNDNMYEEYVSTAFTCKAPKSIPNGERREYMKPIMLSGGEVCLVFQQDDSHLHKGQSEKDMLMVKMSGPANRIGLCGTASHRLDRMLRSVHPYWNAMTVVSLLMQSACIHFSERQYTIECSFLARMIGWHEIDDSAVSKNIRLAMPNHSTA